MRGPLGDSQVEEQVAMEWMEGERRGYEYPDEEVHRGCRDLTSIAHETTLMAMVVWVERTKQ